MGVPIDRQAVWDESDEAQAVTRLILGMTLSAGGMVAASGAATDSPLVVVVLPTVLMGGLLLLGALHAAGWCGVAIWLILVPMARGEGILSALVMMVICALVALGPERVAAWVTNMESSPGAPDEDPAWIEEVSEIESAVYAVTPAPTLRPLRSAGLPPRSARHRPRWSTNCSR